jgi:ankyrin repeat protein
MNAEPRRLLARSWAISFVAVLAAAVLLAASSTGAQGPTKLTPNEQTLMEAAYQGKLDVVQLMLAQGLSVETTDTDKRTPLMWAAFNGHTPVVGYLLEKGSKIDAKDVNGRTALMYASSGPNAETVKLLLEKGADVNTQGTLEGFTALMTAAAEGQADVVRLLLLHGADRKLKDKDGDTAESFARQNGHEVVANLLSQMGS